MDEVLDVLRTAAAAMGCTQTPMLLGLIEGGLTIPVLRPGAKSRAEFPESARPATGADISDLAAYGVPVAVIGRGVTVMWMD